MIRLTKLQAKIAREMSTGISTVQQLAAISGETIAACKGRFRTLVQAGYAEKHRDKFAHYVLTTEGYRVAGLPAVPPLRVSKSAFIRIPVTLPKQHPLVTCWGGI